MKMDYFKPLKELFSRLEASDNKGKTIPIDKAISRVAKLIIAQAKKGKRVFIIGNGGSAGIASHVAIDLLKNAGVPALAFNDAGFLTCIANDLGFAEVFRKPLEVLGESGDILFAISSSGKSPDILNAAEAAGEKRSFVVTLSGFKDNNPLRQMGEINFYVPSHAYGDVEITHLAICHSIVDLLLKTKHG